MQSDIDHGYAAMPILGQRLQPLCGLYRAETWALLHEQVGAGERRMMRWVNRLDVVAVDTDDFLRAGIPPDACCNVNTREELNEFLQRRSAGRGD